MVRAALDATGVESEYGSMPRGFIKSAPLPGFDPKLYPGPPMIWMSKRFVQPGRQVVATVYAPAMYAPCPLLAFLPDGEALRATPQLAGLPVASGAPLSVSRRRPLPRLCATARPVI